MKKTVVFLLFVFFTQNGFCEKKPLIDKGVEYMCSLETENLSGKVQKMILFKQEVNDQEYKSKIKFKSKIFNSTGRLLYDEVLEDNGKLHVFDSVIYNNKNLVAEFKTAFKYDKPTEWEDHHIKYIYDEKKNQISASSVQRFIRGGFNTTSQEQIITTYDSLLNTIKEVRIPDNDTSQITIRKYIYNDFGEYVAAMHIFKSKVSKTEYSEVRNYDENKNFTKQIFYIEGKLNYIREFKYDKNNHKELLTETSGDSIIKITRFNDNGLPIEIQNYKKKNLQSDQFYQYKFDDKNNWIEKKILSQDIIKGEKEANLSSIETRVITYFE
jgi:hypothetical protein